ncbi:MAG: competence/damage-inducible protein A [Alphaproteobacteria bacterium]|nr:competence/damage-inducible protein A [Alphaproteobacteria bacterium]
MGDKKTYTAAIVIIGDEILSGRTHDTNTVWLAERLNDQGIMLEEVRVIPDREAKIIETVNTLRAQFDYIFTTGGIGPTHDDITAASIAKAFDVALLQNPEAMALLVAHYGGAHEVTPARARMAMIPEGATLIHNPVSSAPGFIIGNVHVMAGVPRIMQAMFEQILETLQGGDPLLSNTITCEMAESELAADMASLQEKFPDVLIGSYPHFQAGNFGLSVVLRCTEATLLKNASEELVTMILSRGKTPRALSLQVPIDF